MSTASPTQDDAPSTINPLTELTGFQRDLMLAIDDLGTSSGQAIKDLIEKIGHEDINHGRLYPNLDSLCDKGFVEKRRCVPDARTNSYELTESGSEAVEKYRQYVGE